MAKWQGQAFNRDEQHSRKLDAVLAEAAVLFNRQGFTGTTLEDVAKRLNLTKAALYYYVENKEDLAFLCYRRTCVLQKGYMEEGARLGQNGLGKVAGYIRTSSRQENAISAILTEVPSLKEEHRGIIQKEAHENAHTLRNFIKLGIEDGSIMPCNPTLTSLAIIGALSWTPQWHPRGPGANFDKIGEGFVRVFFDGLRSKSNARADRDAGHEPKTLSGSPEERREIFDREEMARLKREALLKAATASFNQKGVSGTSLNDVVRSLNVTKGAFYYYVKNKDDLLFQCYVRTLDLMGALMDQADREGATGLEKLELVMRGAIALNCGEDGPLAVFWGTSALPDDRRSVIEARALELTNKASGFLEAGLADKTLHYDDLRMTLFALVGAMSWLPKWYDEGRGLASEGIAQAFYDLFADGLRAKP